MELVLGSGRAHSAVPGIWLLLRQQLNMNPSSLPPNSALPPGFPVPVDGSIRLAVHGGAAHVLHLCQCRK